MALPKFAFLLLIAAMCCYARYKRSDGWDPDVGGKSPKPSSPRQNGLGEKVKSAKGRTRTPPPVPRGSEEKTKTKREADQNSNGQQPPVPPVGRLPPVPQPGQTGAGFPAPSVDNRQVSPSAVPNQIPTSGPEDKRPQQPVQPDSPAQPQPVVPFQPPRPSAPEFNAAGSNQIGQPGGIPKPPQTSADDGPKY